jgi:molybdenum cofactor sulfurtransferase
MVAHCTAALTDLPLNPSSTPHLEIDHVRMRILSHFNAIPKCKDDNSTTNSRSDERYQVVFTSGATAALNLIASNIMIPDMSISSSNVEFAKTNLDQINNPSKPSSDIWFLDVNHTSVIGMSPLLKARFPHSKSCFLSFEEIEHFLSSSPSTTTTPAAPALFCFPAQCNFSGARYPIHKWTSAFQLLGSLVLVDAASYCSTAILDV